MRFFVPGGEALCDASNSASVIGRGMHIWLTPQGTHGELLEVSVTGAQELEAVAVSTPPTGSKSLTMIGHGATVG